jgi:hypothetical protein
MRLAHLPILILALLPVGKAAAQTASADLRVSATVVASAQVTSEVSVEQEKIVVSSQSPYEVIREDSTSRDWSDSSKPSTGHETDDVVTYVTIIFA